MVEMSLKELFEIGQSFESSVGEGTKGERARIFKNNSRLNLTDEMISFIESIDCEVNFLVSGEIWCPDFQLNATVLKRFLDLNPNFNMSVITMARGKKFMAPALGIDKESFKKGASNAAGGCLVTLTFAAIINPVVVPIVKPFFSKRGINSPGEIKPHVGWIQRTSASAPAIHSPFRLYFGWR